MTAKVGGFLSAAAMLPFCGENLKKILLASIKLPTNSENLSS
jgi:hypothetical protein